MFLVFILYGFMFVELALLFFFFLLFEYFFFGIGIINFLLLVFELWGEVFVWFLFFLDSFISYFCVLFYFDGVGFFKVVRWWDVWFILFFLWNLKFVLLLFSIFCVIL